MDQDTSEKDCIQVDFKDEATGELIGTAAMMPEQLPESFEQDTTLFLQNQEWRVIAAEPSHAHEFKVSKSLKLKLRKIEKLPPENIVFSLPTVSNELPDVSGTSPFADFREVFHEDSWRQIEFLNRSSFPYVEVEFKAIKEIWDHHSTNMDGELICFTKIHIRDTIGLPNLGVDFQKLQDQLGTNITGSAFLEGQGYVENGFALKTANSVYLGIAADNVVQQLCVLDYNENTINEIKAVNRLFGLICVDWYNCDIIDESE